jgi:hypothetical protein
LRNIKITNPIAISATPTIGTAIAAARALLDILEGFGDAVRVALRVGEEELVLEELVALEELDDLLEVKDSLEEVVVAGVVAACSTSVSVISEVALLPSLAVCVIW